MMLSGLAVSIYFTIAACFLLRIITKTTATATTAITARYISGNGSLSSGGGCSSPAAPPIVGIHPAKNSANELTIVFFCLPEYTTTSGSS